MHLVAVCIQKQESQAGATGGVPGTGFPLVLLRVPACGCSQLCQEGEEQRKLWSRPTKPGEDLDWGQGSRTASESGQRHD